MAGHPQKGAQTSAAAERRQRPVVVSGIQPSGKLMIGNYVGALKSWAALQETHECFFMVADLHAVSAPHAPADLDRRSFELAALFLACGVDLKKSTVFLQSHVPAHTQLMWVLNCVTPMGDLQRMTQYRDKSERHPGGVHAGLFDYPVLMAADILLYGADRVPVGDDQCQHLELTRRIARRFNRRYGEVFKIPKAYIPREGARLMGLQAPWAKMSKSDPDADNFIALLDPPEEVRRKIAKAVTDTGREVRIDAAKPGISNLIALYGAVSGEEAASIQSRYLGRGYAEFKRALAEVIVDFLAPLQARYAKWAADPATLAEALRSGARRARERSEATLDRVYRAVGLVPGEHDRAVSDGGSMPAHRRWTKSQIGGLEGAVKNRSQDMETTNIQDTDRSEAAAADEDAACIEDCCMCCCCDEEECRLEE